MVKGEGLMVKVEKYVVFLMVVVLAGCGGKGPQRPSQRKGVAPEVDSAQLALLQLNQQLAMAADEQIRQIAQAQEETYALEEHGAWIYRIEAGETNGVHPQPDEEWTIHLRTYSLSGQLYNDTERTVRIGHYELPLAIEGNIGEWYHGTHVRMLAPWYAAYGLQGTEQIPPYENVIMDIELR